MSFFDDAVAEHMPRAQRARVQPADDVAAEPITAPAAAPTSAEAAGEKTGVHALPNALGTRRPAFLSYGINLLCIFLPTPQVKQLKALQRPANQQIVARVCRVHREKAHN